MTTESWNLLTEALIKVVILAFLIERALVVIFEMEKFEPTLKDKDLKGPIAILVSIAACAVLQIDAFGPLGGKDGPIGSGGAFHWISYFLTGLVVAGGSAGAVKLFQDVLGFRRTSRDELKRIETTEREAQETEAMARVEKAKAEIANARAATVGATALVSLPGALSNTPERQIFAARIAERDLKIARGA